jgi:hypothetical protein
MVENFGDVPFFKDAVPPETVAAMTAVAGAVKQAVDVPVGVNVLRNDVRSAIAIASAAGASFVRVNVLVGAYVTDQGLIEGKAAEVMRYRRAMGADDIAVWADVRVKHAAPLGERAVEVEAEDLIDRAGAEAVIVSGEGTGKPVNHQRLQAVHAVAMQRSRPALIGSGATLETIRRLASYCNGFIVGTHFKRDGKLDAPVDPDRVRRFIDALNA